MKFKLVFAIIPLVVAGNYGDYRKCPDVCPLIYSPVCGTDGVTYSSPCQFQLTYCKKPYLGVTYSSGECKNCAIKYKCSDKGPAVCGFDKVTYPNLCQFRSKYCDKPKATYINGACPTIESCPQVCYLIYKPVCYNGKTYGNECEYRRDNCNNKGGILLDGACPNDVKCEEIGACTAVYLPVCGSNGQTYGNECEFKRANCPNKGVTFTQGKCHPKDVSVKPGYKGIPKPY